MKRRQPIMYNEKNSTFVQQEQFETKENDSINNLSWNNDLFDGSSDDDIPF